MKKYKLPAFLIALVAVKMCFAQHTFVIKANEKTATIQPTMWGVFFEDINLGADGGIYAELIKNRSFEFFKPLMGWTVERKKFVEGQVQIINDKEASASNPRYLRINLNNAAQGDLALVNEGFRGMGFKQGLRYDFSIAYRQTTNNVKLHVELIDSNNNVLGDTIVTPSETGNTWHKATASLHCSKTELKGKMRLWFEGNGLIDIDMVSLFPSDTWKNRPGGMRADMVQMLADMKPGFIRFPGGCIVEGYDLEQRYRWKNTIGPLEDRQLIINRWNFEFPYRAAPDYFQTFGLGFFEYFQLAEDIGAEPLPILNAGMACQFNSSELVPLNELQPYVQDVLDLIEFANGDTTTQWGKVRAQMGHPKPFNLKMMGVGNENWGPQYVERLKIFTKAIKEKYPDFKLVNSSGTDPDSDRYYYLNNELRNMHADIIDEHYYRAPEWFLQNAKRYDTFPKTGSKVFAGEYAAHVKNDVVGPQRNNWRAALAEAAFMTGLERNASVVNMASYAPLFAQIDGWQWAPDLIWVNNLNVYGTPNYFVQKLYSLNKGTNVVPITLNNDVVAGQDSLYAAACIDTNTNELIIKIVNVSNKQQANTMQLSGVKKLASQAKLTQLTGDLAEVNSFTNPGNIEPQESTINVSGKKINFNAPPYSFNVLRIKMQ